ncbi:MAG: EamA/RhaT family transporter, partial [Gammaproteobacteria bacterium]|nr:EamA/RhaT family transporter [Gammaproteobacteria bacterium]
LGYGAWVGLIEIGVAFLLWQRAMALTKQSGKLGALIFLAPFLSLVLIATVLGEAIHPSAMAGLALIAAGLVLSRWPSEDNTRRGGMC